MDDNYLDEVLPRWQFWKEYLIAQMEEYMEGFKEGSKTLKLSAEMLEKIKEVKTKTDLIKISDEITSWQKSVIKDCNHYGDAYAGVFWTDVVDDDKLSNWLNIERFARTIKHETNKGITK